MANPNPKGAGRKSKGLKKMTFRLSHDVAKALAKAKLVSGRDQNALVEAALRHYLYLDNRPQPNQNLRTNLL